MSGSINLNDKVKVKLTPYGQDCLREYFTELFILAPNKQYVEDSINLYSTKEDGYMQTQLWDLMQIFGSYIRLGGRMPFESTEIIYES